MEMMTLLLIEQTEIQKKVMGVKFWEKKLRKYMEVKDKLRHSTENMDTVAKREEKQQKKVADRRSRIANRKREARNATSGVKRNLLVALNMAEAFLL